MTKVVLDAQLRSKLLDLNQPCMLCEESGRVVGTFIPVGSPPNGYSEPPLTEDEWRRREQGPGYTTDEVIARLEQL